MIDLRSSGEIQDHHGPLCDSKETPHYEHFVPFPQCFHIYMQLHNNPILMMITHV